MEDELGLALRKQLPKEWIIRDKEPDIGIDMEIEIVEGGYVTNKILWLQLKATESNKIISMSMETKHLKHYENCRTPVIIIYGMKKSNGEFDFNYIFAQKYIKEILSEKIPQWRKQKTVTIRFDTHLNPEELDILATEGYFYIASQQLNILPTGASYWLDGIPKSDDKALKDRMLKALLCLLDEKYNEAITEFKNIWLFSKLIH